MSKIFVDQVDPKTGTSLTLGTSGDTVNIPSGVTLANAGTVTGLPASAISSGTIATARLGSGTASSSTFLRGDQTYAAAGESNNPSFFAYMSAHQAVADNVNTKVAFNTALFATSGTYDTTNYRWTPGVAGNYQLNVQVVGDSQATANLYANTLYVFKNGSGLGIRPGEVNNNYVDNYPRQHAISLNICVQSDADDYFEVWAATNDTSSTPQFFSYGSYFGGFLISGSA